MFSLIKAAATAAVIAVSGTMAHAATIYDGSALTGNTSNRSAGDAPLGNFTFAVDTEITGFSQLINASDDGNAHFVIFENSTLVYSDINAFTSTGAVASFASDTISFLAAANTTYYIGALLDVAAEYTFLSPSIADDIQGDITQIDGNGNVRNFASPGLYRNGNAVIAVSLEGEAMTAAVPLPAGLPLLLAGLGIVGFVGRNRRRIA